MPLWRSIPPFPALRREPCLLDLWQPIRGRFFLKPLKMIQELGLRSQLHCQEERKAACRNLRPQLNKLFTLLIAILQ